MYEEHKTKDGMQVQRGVALSLGADAYLGHGVTCAVFAAGEHHVARVVVREVGGQLARERMVWDVLQQRPSVVLRTCLPDLWGHAKSPDVHRFGRDCVALPVAHGVIPAGSSNLLEMHTRVRAVDRLVLQPDALTPFKDHPVTLLRRRDCDLRAALDMDLPRREEVATRLIGQLGMGLGYLHLHGVIHGDVKPENVLVSAATMADPATWALSITDLGLSSFMPCVRRACFGEANAEKKPQNAWVQSLPYRAPELLLALSKGETHAHFDGQAADVYALGCIAYELLTRERYVPDQALRKICCRATEREDVAMPCFRTPGYIPSSWPIDTPGYIPSSPGYTPSSPGGSLLSPDYHPSSPVDSSSPVYHPSSPGYTPSSPVDSSSRAPCVPSDSPSSPASYVPSDSPSSPSGPPSDSPSSPSGPPSPSYRTFQAGHTPPYVPASPDWAPSSPDGDGASVVSPTSPSSAVSLSPPPPTTGKASRPCPEQEESRRLLLHLTAAQATLSPRLKPHRAGACVARMLSMDPTHRPTTLEVFETLTTLRFRR